MTLWTAAHQDPLPMGFSRQEYRSGLSCPPPGELPNPGTEPVSLMSPALAGGFFTLVSPAKGEAPVFWSPDANSWSIGKVPDCWETLRAEGEEGIRRWEGWMASPMQRTWIWANFGRWGEGQGGLACYSPWGGKELDKTGGMNNNRNIMCDCS